MYEEKYQKLSRPFGNTNEIGLMDKKRLLELLEDEEVKEKINSSVMDTLKATLAKCLNIDSDSSDLKIKVNNLKNELAHAKK